MKIALDPYMLRSTPLLELPGVVADLGYEHIELSPREDFTPFFLHPRVDDAGVKAFKKALDGAGVKVAAHLPLYRWSGPDEDERQAAVRYWKRAIQITVDLDCHVMNSEFNGRPEAASLSEAQFWKSMEELLPVFEREGVELRLEPHPDDFVEDGLVAVDLIRGINSPLVSFLYCAPHTFHMGGNMVEIMEYAGDLMTQLHLADSFDHTGSSGLRYITNPPGNPIRVHQHLDIGQGEVQWDLFFETLNKLGFGQREGNIMTSCVFAWEERAEESSRFMRRDDRLLRGVVVSTDAAAPDALDLLTVGRVGVDIYPQQNGPLKDVSTFAKYLGGTATNVAVGAARLGRRTAVLTKVGPDPFGDFVREALVGFGVDPQYVGTAEGLNTPVVFCELDPPEDPGLFFYRQPIGSRPDDRRRRHPVGHRPRRAHLLGHRHRRQRGAVAHLSAGDAQAPRPARDRLRSSHRARPRLAADVLVLARTGEHRVRRDARPRHRRGRQPGRGRGGRRHQRSR